MVSTGDIGLGFRIQGLGLRFIGVCRCGGSKECSYLRLIELCIISRLEIHNKRRRFKVQGLGFRLNGVYHGQRP